MASSSYKVKVIDGFALNEIALLMLDPHPKIHEHKKATRITHLTVKQAGNEPGIWTMPAWEVEITGVERTSNPYIWKIKGKRSLEDGAEYFRGLYSTKTREGFLFVTKAVKIRGVHKSGKMLIVVRHGNEMTEIISALRPFIRRHSKGAISILSSELPYSLGFTNGLQSEFGIRRRVRCDVLGRVEKDQRHHALSVAIDAVTEHLNKSEISLLIVVVPEELATSLPSGFCERSMQMHIPTIQLKPSQARVIYTDEKRDEISEVIG